MAVTETTHQQSPELHPDELKPSDDVSSSATGHDEPYEKTAEAEAGLSQPKPPAGPPGGPPPNGGLTAWLQVLGGFFLFFNTWGILNTFGVFQTYYESGELFRETSSNISWIGSVQSVCVLFVGSATGPVFDRGHLRLLLLIGSFGVVFGFMMLSLCKEFWQAMLAQGFCIGLGGGMLFVPSVAIMPTYFNTRLGLAIGLAASGSSMGGIIYPIVFYRLLPQIGFGWAVRVLGFMALATLLIPISVMKMRVQPPKARSLLDTTVFTDYTFILFVAGAMIGFIGLYVELFYISFFGEATGYTDSSMSFYLVPILNAGSVFGRTLPNMLSDKIGPINVIIPGAVICSILVFCNMAVDSLGGIVVQALLFGFFSGIFIALPPVCFFSLTADKTKLGTRLGMGFAVIALGVLAGGPGGGAILQSDPSNLDWKGTWAYSGATLIAAGAIFFIVRFLKVGAKVVTKV
ncbi:hypothetical protein WHR41_03315 [Cladosporium halotolerans]|uniref:Major facilitator superfamily (MFS) profile domain-containing protein n=1 Tax=Cladosporium halotolerans TaxID=1052096 RepID=A0AB34KY79_9PEZI